MAIWWSVRRTLRRSILISIYRNSKTYQSIEAYPAERKNEESLYTSQKGTIEICDIKFNNPPDVGYKAKFGHKYSSEKYFASDCFYNSKLNEGDKVIVFLFSYEGEYCIPNGSILKIEDFNDPIVKSVENYIFNKQNPLSIQDDIAKWKKYGLDYALKQIIECRLNNEITR